MLWLILAQAAAVPYPPNRFPETAGLLNYMDAPDFFLRGGNAVRVVLTRTTVRPDGKVDRCESERPSGDPKLDAYTCDKIRHRAQFVAGHWLDGTPAYSVLRAPIMWSVGDVRPDPRRMSVPDLDLLVKQRPGDTPITVNVPLEVAVDATGKIVSCQARASSASRPASPAALVTVACDRATGQLHLRPPLDEAGQPVRSVQTATARFTVAP